MSDELVARDVLAGERDPVRVLEGLREQCAPGGTLVVDQAVDRIASLRWPRTPVARLDARGGWHPNRAALLRMLGSAGFEVEAASGPLSLPRVRVRARPV